MVLSASRNFKALVLICICASVGWAETYYVSSSGRDTWDGSVRSPFKTLTKAATVLEPGDVVLVSGGNYSEENIVPSQSGTEDAMVIFKARPNTGTVTISHPATSTGNNDTPIFNLSNRNYIWIEGFQFKGFEYGMASIVIAHGLGNVVINNRFEALGNPDVESWDENSVIWVYKSTDNLIRNNYFSDIYGDGVSLNGQGTNRNLVCENTFIDFYGKKRSWGGNYLFSRAIDIQDMSNGNNVIAFNYADGVIHHIWLDRDGSNNVILRNIANHSSGLVFNESRCASNIIQENIGTNLQTAFQTARYDTTGWTYDARWINNIAYNNQIGFYVHKSERDEFRNNITFNNTNYNIVFTDEALSNTPHIFENNLWYTQNKWASIQLSGKAVSVSQFRNAVGEVNGISTDPRFTAADTGDFTLTPTSPALGAGDGGVDMGAYAVYGPNTVAGWDPALELSPIQVTFDGVISQALRGQETELTLKLNRTTLESVSVDIVPVAGDACLDEDFQWETQTITFEPGETTKVVPLSILGSSEHDELVAFRLENIVNAQSGPGHLRLLRISPSGEGSDSTDRNR